MACSGYLLCADLKAEDRGTAADVSSLGAEGGGPVPDADLKADLEARGDGPEGDGVEPLKVRGARAP